MEPGSTDGGFDLSSTARSFASTVRDVLFEPSGFFRRLLPRGSARNPAVFAVLCALISFPLTLLAEPFDPIVEDDQGLRLFFSEFGSRGGRRRRSC